MADTCELPGAWDALEGSYEEICARFDDDKTWIRFFVRPCCPPPGRRVARTRTDELIEQILKLERFSEEERDKLLMLAEERFEWYCTKFRRS